MNKDLANSPIYKYCKTCVPERVTSVEKLQKQLEKIDSLLKEMIDTEKNEYVLNMSIEKGCRYKDRIKWQIRQLSK